MAKLTFTYLLFLPSIILVCCPLKSTENFIDDVEDVTVFWKKTFQGRTPTMLKMQQEEHGNNNQVFSIQFQVEGTQSSAKEVRDQNLKRKHQNSIRKKRKGVSVPRTGK